MAIVHKKWSEADVIADAIGERSYRDAADWLNEKLPSDFQISHATVHNWVEGAFKMNYGFMFALALFYEDDDPRCVLGQKVAEMRRKDG